MRKSHCSECQKEILVPECSEDEIKSPTGITCQCLEHKHGDLCLSCNLENSQWHHQSLCAYGAPKESDWFWPEKTRSNDQIERQKHRESNGKYAKVNPCYVCGKSAGVNYYSHPDTDRTINDELLVLCGRCMKKYQDIPGKEAIKMAFPKGESSD